MAVGFESLADAVEYLRYLESVSGKKGTWKLVAFKHVEMTHGPPVRFHRDADTIEITIQVVRVDG